MAAKAKRTSKSKDVASKLKTPSSAPVSRCGITLDFKAMGLLKGEALVVAACDEANAAAAAASTADSAAKGPAPRRKKGGSLHPLGFSHIGTAAIMSDFTAERELRALRAQRIGEWISRGAATQKVGDVLYKKDPAFGLSEVEGSYLYRIPGYSSWFPRLSKEEKGLQWVALNQELLDSALELGDFFEPESLGVCFWIPDEVLSDDVREMLPYIARDLYGELGIMHLGEDEDGHVFVDFDVANMFAAIQSLTAYALSSLGCCQELIEMAKSLDSALSDVSSQLSAQEEKTEAVERRLAQAKSSLEGRPTRGDLERANTRIAELEQQVADLQAQQSAQAREDSIHEANMIQVARQQARQEVAGQIDALVRSQAETEQRARDAEASLERAYSKLDTAERRRSENQRIHDAEVRSLKQALAAAGTGSQSESPCFPASEIAELPQTAASVLELAARAFSDKLVVLDSAYDSADDYKGDPYEVWTMMRALATDGYDLYLGEHSYDVRAEFRNRTGIELSTTEPSMGTKEDKKAWETTYNGKSYSLCNHIKGSKRKNYDSLRIHFAVDREDKVLIVAHCGDHLPSCATRRRGW